MTPQPARPLREPAEFNKALAPAAWAALSAMLSETLTGRPVSTLIPAPTVGTA